MVSVASLESLTSNDIAEMDIIFIWKYLLNKPFRDIFKKKQQQQNEVEFNASLCSFP